MSLVLRVGYGGEGGFGCGVSCCAGVCCAGWDKDRSGGIGLLVGFTIIWMGICVTRVEMMEGWALLLEDLGIVGTGREDDIWVFAGGGGCVDC